MKSVQTAINYVRGISAEAISKAKSGHTGSSVGAATILFALFKDHYKFDINDENFINRDRLVLSAGHVSPLYYTLMYMFNMGITSEDLKKLRKIDGLPGHPEKNKTRFVEASTGPLGQGVANAVGMAIAQSMVMEKFNAQRFPIINNYTYCFVGDGCLMEGVAQEAISIAGNLCLNKLILLYDDNNITIDGNVGITNSENVAKKFKAQNWNVIKVCNGNNYTCVTKAIARAKRSKKPTIIIFKTQIGYGTEYEGKNVIHGKPLSLLELEQYKIKLGVQGDFYLPKEVADLCQRTVRKNNVSRDKWEKMLCLYEKTHPELYKQFIQYFSNKFDFSKIQKQFVNEDMSGREANKVLLNLFASKIPRLVGGCADVEASTLAKISDIENDEYYSKNNRRGRNIHFGIREHGMGAICNGISLYLNSPSFCSTFLSFANYMIPAIRMASIMNLPVQYYFTHDSFKVGQDGATHQPIEQIGQLRLIPNLNVFRPCDINELYACQQVGLSVKNPSAYLLSRQSLPALNSDIEKAKRGAYIIENSFSPEVVIMASGSEVETALETKKLLEKNSINSAVVSVPCIEVFEQENGAYKRSVLMPNAKLHIYIEASNDTKILKLCPNAVLFGINEYGASGTLQELEKHYKYNASTFAKKIISLLK